MKRCSPLENSLALPQNVQHRFPAGPSSVTPTYTPEKNENLCPAPNSHKHIGSWQKVEATQMSISGCIEKRNLVYLHKGTWKLAKRKKLVPKEQILIYYLIPLIWHMADRNYTSSYPAPELERQMADRYSGSCRGSENVLKLTVVMVVHFRGHTKNHWPLTCILPFFFFNGHTFSIWEFPGQWQNLHLCRDRITAVRLWTHGPTGGASCTLYLLIYFALITILLKKFLL